MLDIQIAFNALHEILLTPISLYGYTFTLLSIFAYLLLMSIVGVVMAILLKG